MPERIPPPPPGFRMLDDVPPPPPGFRLLEDEPQLPAVVPGSEKLGPLPGPAKPKTPMREVMTPGKVADVTLGGIGGGIMHTIEGAGGAMRAVGAETVGKAVSDFGARYGKAPKWLEEVSQSPDRLYDPAFVTNMAFEGLGSSLSFFVPGAGAGRAAAAAAKLPIGLWKNIAVWAAGTATASVMESAVDAGSAYNDAIDKGLKPEVAAHIFTETMKREVPTTMLTNAAGEFAPRLGGNVWKKAMQVGFDAAMEGGEEVAQGAAQISAENAVLGTDKSMLEGAPEKFVGGLLGGALMSGGRAVVDRMTQPKPKPQPEDVDVDVPLLGPGQTAGKPQPGRPPKALLEKPPIAAGPVGEKEVDPFAPQNVEVDGQRMVLIRNADGTYRGYNVSEGQALVPVQRKRGNENTAGAEGTIPQGGQPQARIEGREQKLLPGEVQKEEPKPRVFRSAEGMYFEEQPDGSYRGVQKPAPGKPPAGYLEEGPRFYMGPATKERGNRNKAAEQGPFEMPASAEEVPPPPPGFTMMEPTADAPAKAETATENARNDDQGNSSKSPAADAGTSSESRGGSQRTPILGRDVSQISDSTIDDPSGKRGKEISAQPQTTSTQVDKPEVEAEPADDPWESFADDLSQAGVSIPHMVNSFKKNFNLDLEKEVREGRFGTGSMTVDQLKDLTLRYPQKGAKPAPRKRSKPKEPEVSLEDQLAASLRARGIEVPAEPTADVREEVPEQSRDSAAQIPVQPAPDTSTSTQDISTQPNTSEMQSTTSRNDNEIQPQPQATAEPKHEYSSTQVAVPGIVGKRMKEASARIPDTDLAEDGREDDPHVTVKYGLHGEDAEEVRKLLAGEGPIRVKLGKSSLFENDDADVLKVDVESEDLRRLNAKIAALPNSDQYPEYKPHATIAYLKPGSGKKYSGKPIPGVSGAELTIYSLTFSGKNGERVEIPLTGETKSDLIETLEPKPETKDPGMETKAPASETKDVAAAAGLKPEDLIAAVTKKLEGSGRKKVTPTPTVETSTLPGGGKIEVIESPELRFPKNTRVRYERGGKTVEGYVREVKGNTAMVGGEPDQKTGAFWPVKVSQLEKIDEADTPAPLVIQSLQTGKKEILHPRPYNPNRDLKQADRTLLDRAKEKLAAQKVPFGVIDPLRTSIESMRPDDLSPADREELHDFIGTPPEKRFTNREDLPRDRAEAKKSLQQQFEEKKAQKQKKRVEADTNPLREAANAARERLRAKMRGQQLSSGIDPQDLIDIATIGAEKMIDGAGKFKDWSAQMREDVGDLVDWMAQTTEQTADQVLRQIHGYARTVALQFGAEVEDNEGEDGKQQPGVDNRIPLEEELSETGEGTPAGGDTPAKRTKRSRKSGTRAGASASEGVERAGGDGTRDGGVEDSPEPVAPEVVAPVSLGNTRLERDYRIPDNRTVGGSPEKRFETNIAAIRLLRQLEKEDRLPTADEQDVLASYVGWGAVPQLFAANTEEWRKRQDELREVLSDEEFEHARRSTTNAHYTSDAVIDAMWVAMEHMGAKPGMSWLEPAVGIGNFLGRQPAAMLEGARRVGLDKDTITGKLAQKLYPDSGIEVVAYEKAELPENYFDGAISNVPFGDFGVSDPAFRGKDHLTNPIHNYFFAKSLSYVRPGGVIGFVTSRYTMDGYEQGHTRFREWMDKRAEFLGAVRLPSNAFMANAGTHVITDVLFFRKRMPGEEAGEPGVWTKSNRREFRADGRWRYHSTNDYFAQNTGNILGQETISRGQFSDADYDVKGTVTPQQLKEALKRILPEGAFREWKRETKDTKVRLGEVEGGHDSKIGALFFDKDGRLYRRTSRGSAEPMDLPEASKSRIKAQMGIRDTLTKLLDAELNDRDDSLLKALREKLNLQYDIFVKKNGPLSSRTNIAAMDGDPDGPLLLSLEKNFDGKTAKKAAIFEKRILEKAKSVKSAATGQDALMVSLNEMGRIDWERMSALTGQTAEDLQRELAGVVFEDPVNKTWHTAEEYLSGSVREKLRQARQIAKVEKKFEANVKALEAVQPEDIPASNIFARIGVTWVPREVYEEFIRVAAGLPDTSPVTVNYAPALGEWAISFPKWQKSSTKFETKRVDLGELLSDAFNMRQPKVYDRVPGGNSVYNDKETIAAMAKLEELQNYFQEWLFGDSERGPQMVRLYNDRHNDLRLRTYDGSHLTLPGMAKGIILHTHQRAAIWRVVTQPNALLAHAVGAGKTFEMIAGGMELKRMGLVKRPMYVVPNATLSGWQEQFTALYPSARVLVFSEKDLEKSNRQKIMARIATGEWDAVVVPHSSFQFLRVSDELFDQHYDQLAKELEDQIKEAEEGGMDTRLIKRMEKAKETLLTNLEKRRAAERQDKTVSWEQLGIDQLFVDEAHEYKKLGFATKQGNIAGIDQAGNQKTFDLIMKMRHTQAHGRGVVFATGTPVTNTMGEMFTLMRYLTEADLKGRGMGKFDEWSANYGRTVQVFEPKPEGGGYHRKARFSKFVNIPELAALFRSFSDVVTSDMLDIPRPKPVFRETVSEMSDEQQEFMLELQQRAKKIRDNPRDAMPDCMLAVYTDAAKMALDVRLVDPSAPDHPGSRLNKAADNIFEIWKSSTEKRSAQIVFMDMGKPTSEGGGQFSTYDDLIGKLIERGIPRDEIAHIYQAKNKQQRAKLFQSVREGRVRVLMGSTPKLGVGVNVQDKLIAAHHLDLPHRPSDYEQRNGRIERQGNENPEVQIFTYLTRGTLDELKSASLARKAKFISQMMQGKSTVREAEDVGGMIASFEQFQAAASGDSRVLRMMEVGAEVDRLSAVKASWQDQRWAMRQEAQRLPQTIEFTKGLIQKLNKWKEQRDKAGKVWVIGGKRFEGEGYRAKVVDAINGLGSPVAGQLIGTVYGFKLYWRGDNDRDDARVEGIKADGLGRVAGIDRKWSEAGTSPVDPGVIQSIESDFTNFERRIASNQEDLDRHARRATEILSELDKPWPYTDQFEKLQAEQAELVKALGLDKDDESAGATEGGDITAKTEAEETEGEEEDKSGEAGFASPELFGAHLIARGLTKIEAWIKAMVERYGPEIRKRALAIYREAKRLAKDEEGSITLRSDKNRGRYKGRRFWIAMVDLRDGHIIETHSYETAEANDFHHSMYFGAAALEAEKEGDAAVFFVDGIEYASAGREAISKDILRKLKDIAPISKEGFAKRLWSDEEGSLNLSTLRQSGEKAGRMVRDAYDVALKPMGARIKDESPRLASMLQHARDVGDVMAGGFLNRLVDAKLDKLTKIEQGMLAAVLEGKMTRAPRKVVDAYRVVRNLENDVAAIAQSYDVDPAKVLSRKYEEDTARSIPHQFAAAGEKLAQMAEFGTDNAELKKILQALGEVDGNPKQVGEWVERIFKGVDEGKTQEEKVTRFIRGLQTAKLGLAFIPNASQAILNVTPASDFRALWAGYKALLSAEGRRFAVESGAAIDPVLAEAHQELGLGWLTQKFMTPFRLVEQHNRVVAASAGADFAARLWKMAQSDTKKGKWAARKLADLGVDASTPLTRADILMAAKKFTDQTQFRSRPENLPAWTTTPWGRVFFQFKTFSYQQAKFTLDQTIGELRRGAPLRAGRNLAMFALLGGGLGELIRVLRNLLTGKEDDPEGMERVAKAMASAGAMGVMLDATQAMERGKELEWLAGPGADMGIAAARLGWTWIDTGKGLDDKVEATKKFAYRHMPLGSVAKGIEERLQ